MSLFILPQNPRFAGREVSQVRAAGARPGAAFRAGPGAVLARAVGAAARARAGRELRRRQRPLGSSPKNDELFDEFFGKSSEEGN